MANMHYAVYDYGYVKTKEYREGNRKNTPRTGGQGKFY
jgi:hypothetical protein